MNCPNCGQPYAGNDFRECTFCHQGKGKRNTVRRSIETMTMVAAALAWVCLAVPAGYYHIQADAPPAVKVTIAEPVDPIKAIFPQKPMVTNFAADCRILRVIDGDTIEVEIRRTLRVRLLQCWAPESRTKDLEEKERGLAAKHHLIDLTTRQDRGRLMVPMAEDLGDVMTLGRVLGHVWLEGDDISLSQRQVDAGFASATDPKGRH